MLSFGICSCKILLPMASLSLDKNPADVLTKYLSNSTLRKLLPKLGVMTRAAESKDVLSMTSCELPACSQECPDSFFIGMMAEELVTAQLVASRVASRSLHSSLQEHSQEVVPNLPATQIFLIEQRLAILIQLCCFALCDNPCVPQ